MTSVRVSTTRKNPTLGTPISGHRSSEPSDGYCEAMYARTSAASMSRCRARVVRVWLQALGCRSRVLTCQCLHQRVFRAGR